MNKSRLELSIWVGVQCKIKQSNLHKDKCRAVSIEWFERNGTSSGKYWKGCMVEGGIWLAIGRGWLLRRSSTPRAYWLVVIDPGGGAALSSPFSPPLDTLHSVLHLKRQLHPHRKKNTNHICRPSKATHVPVHSIFRGSFSIWYIQILYTFDDNRKYSNISNSIPSPIMYRLNR